MNSRTARRGFRIGTVAGVIALLATLGFAMPANAATPLVDPNAVGSIDVHKFVRPDTLPDLANDGTAVDTTGLTPLAGVTFAVQRVQGIDLSTNAGWVAASTLSTTFDPASPVASVTAASYTLGTAASQTTTATGDALFANLPLGVYLVQETNAPAGVTASAPFLVTVPLTDPDNRDAWLYDINVYPKNSVTSATKTVDDAQAIRIGDQVPFTITADIPNDPVIDAYRIVDALDAKLTYASTTVTLADGTPIVLGTDFTVVHDAATNTVTVDFTPTGLGVLAAHNTTSVVVKIVTTVNAVGEIANTAAVYPNQSSIDTDTPTTTPPVETMWGGITVQKVGPNGAALTGATFQVFTSAADAAARTNPVTLGGATSFTVVNADGTLDLSGLRYSDFANGATVAPGDPGYIQYFLVETVAPSGYELLAEPIQFTVTATTSEEGVDLTVTNVPHNGGFALPYTGGAGTTLVYVAGAVLLAGGALFLAIRRLRRRSQA